jgi:NAD-dependent deacetylase
MEQARLWVAEARSVAALTGAGISAESGIPTFRGAGGLWKQYRAEELATPEAFAANPQLVWEWYDWRRQVIGAAQPNAGHRALAELERSKRRFSLVTQNVDGLHDRAGSERVIKIHGDIWLLRCTRCNREWRDLSLKLDPLPPVCACGAMARPGVVWFGEALPHGPWRQAAEAVSSVEVLLVVGTSALVFPAAQLTPMARAAGAKVIEVNIAATGATSLADLSILAPAGEAMPVICGL